MKTVKNILASIMIIPVLALGIGALTLNSSVHAVESIGDGAAAVQGDDTPSELFGEGGIIEGITNTILYVLGAISVIMLIYGGIRYTISGGDSAQVTAAKNTILYAVVGVVVALLAYAIINFVIGELV